MAFGAFFPSKITYVAPPAPTIEDKVTILSIEYGISYIEMYKTLQGESELDHTVCEKGGYCDGGSAYGVAQFHKPTFESFKKTAIVQGYSFEDFDYYNEDDQLELMAWAFKNNLKHHWTAYTLQFGG